jgi:hypothetical protein
MEAGNAFLDAKFLDELNGRYAVKADRQTDLHRAVEAGTVLAEVLCAAEERVVGNDWCVRWKGRWLQVDAAHAELNLPGRKLTVKQRADGVLVVLRGAERLTFKELQARPAGAKARKPAVNNRRYKPAASHPWNRPGPTGGGVPRAGRASAAPTLDLHAEKTRKAG